MVKAAHAQTWGATLVGGNRSHSWVIWSGEQRCAQESQPGDLVAELQPSPAEMSP